MLSVLNNYFFFLFLTTLAVSDNLALFFIGWVGLNISLYGVLLKSFNSYNKEITLKYFISGSIVTMFLLFSILLYFLEYFTLSITSGNYLYLGTDKLRSAAILALDVSKVQKVFYSILICSLLFKLGSFPFHFYLADMYQALNERETMFIYTIALKIAVFLTLLKILTSFWYLNSAVFDLLITSGFASMFISSFSLLKQYKLSKFWAYSYLNSIGFTLLAVSAGISSEFGEVSFYSAKVYFFTYILTWFGILDFIASFSLKSVNGSVNRKLYYLTDLMYLSDRTFFRLKSLPISNLGSFFTYHNKGYYFAALLVSLFGLPPLLGFFSKALVYFDLASNSQTMLVFIFVLFLTPVVSFAYLKLIIYSLVTGGSQNSVSKVSGSTVFLVETSEPSAFILSYKSVVDFLILFPTFYFLWSYVS